MNRETLVIGDYLPPIYRHLLPELFASEIPRETRATCDDCVMCAKEATPAGLADTLGLKFFSPETKCCTYHPSLPNFLVGAVFESGDMASGTRRLREKIASGVGVTPRGILAPRKYSLFYDHASEFFGRSSTMLCPYYDGGGCTIWRHREAVCTTYFCKYERGVQGKQFWDDLKGYLGIAELKLSLHAAARLFTDSAQLKKLWDTWDGKGAVTLEELEGRPLSDERRLEMWGEWVGREEEYYRAAYREISSLDGAGFRAATGIDERFFRAKLEVALENVRAGEPPRRLRKNPEMRATKQGDDYVVSPSRVGDAFELNGLVFPLLARFDGTRDYPEVVEEIRRENGMTLPKEIIAKLYYLGVLVA